MSRRIQVRNESFVVLAVIQYTTEALVQIRLRTANTNNELITKFLGLMGSTNSCSKHHMLISE